MYQAYPYVLSPTGCVWARGLTSGPTSCGTCTARGEPGCTREAVAGEEDTGKSYTNSSSSYLSTVGMSRRSGETSSGNWSLKLSLPIFPSPIQPCPTHSLMPPGSPCDPLTLASFPQVWPPVQSRGEKHVLQDFLSSKKRSRRSALGPPLYWVIMGTLDHKTALIQALIGFTVQGETDVS